VREGGREGGREWRRLNKNRDGRGAKCGRQKRGYTTRKAGRGGREGGGREGYPVAERAVIPVKVVHPGIPLDKEAFRCRCQERKRGRAGRRKR
jgi:hypothetical protein